MNVNHEKKAEEFAFYKLFPEGKNGLNEDREVKITPLDYYQSRLLGKYSRFQSTDYLFYALSMFEYYRMQSTISAMCKKVQGKDGTVDDVHLYMKNLRGSAAYWRNACNELVSTIRCSLSIMEVQRLVEKNPIVISRQFMRRVQAIMTYLKADVNVLDGKLVDYWSRIEFQNRGSPHLHMVTWIENAPPFESLEGIKLIDNVVSCHYPSEEENQELHDLVKGNQIHRHTHTCHKNNSEFCRFAFPRPARSETTMVSATSDAFIRNGGRTCMLKRQPHEKYVNNYNPTILRL